MKEAFTQLSPTSIGQDGTSEHEFVPLTLKRTISQRTKFSASPPMKTVLEERINEALKTSDQRGLHVLIVEDNIINQKVLSQQLKRAGCIVHVANHGVECLDFLEKSTYCSATTPLSIILLDLEMPIMDGLTCIRQIRQRQKGGQIQGHVPVIAVTANARHEQISTAIEAGMDSVVTKPFRIPELIPQMEKLIKEVSQLAAALLETAVEGS
jgi:CheY-like chemotaxis protein